MQRLSEQLGLSQRVLFTGPLKDVRPWYGAADGFVLPTLYDPCPNAALEALACGLPVVTSTTCGAQEWVHSGDNGWVVDAVDINGWRNVSMIWPDWPAIRQARAAARAVAEPLTLPAMADRLLTLYRALGR